jgi:pyrimidine operon attenuation protein/uracil phosphoribosyltransferase
VDRGGRQLPIAPQFLGAAVALHPGQSIELQRDARGRLALVLHDA